MSGRAPLLATPVATASLCAALIIATQVAGKAARDALFLTSFHIAALPVMLMVSALVSIGAVLVTARALARHGPSQVVPVLFFGSGVLLAGEWAVAAHDTRLGSILVYLHIAVIGSILISGFWSTVNEHFDPRTAKRNIGQIVGSASAGGLLGGLLAERLGTFAGTLWVLPVVAAFHLVCAILLVRMRSFTPRAAALPHGHDVPPGRSGPRGESGAAVLRRVPYLRHVALIVLLGNVAAALVDFVFKARAAQSYTNSADLVRFFAVFYTVVSLVTLVVQAGFTRRLIESVGVAKTMAIRPAAVAAGGLLALPVMTLAGLAILRGLEAVVQGSLYRSSYELLFTPVVPSDKRSTKTIIDVGADRLGDTVGGLIIRGMLFLPVAIAGQLLLILAAAISFLGLLLARALHAGYVRALEASLLDRATALDLDPVEPPEMRTLMESFTGLDVSMSIHGVQLHELRRAVRPPIAAELPAPAAPVVTARAPAAPAPAADLDPDLALLAVLRSGDAHRIRNRLLELRPTNPMIAAQVIALLAWDEVTVWAARALAKAAPAVTGQLVDRLLDADEDFAIRRRIPRILATSTSARARDGLLEALADKRFEVRYQAGSALAALHHRQPMLAMDSGSVYAAALRETQVEKARWEDQRLIDELPPGDSALVPDDALRAGSSRSLEHVFTILSLVLPRTPLQIAFRGLLTGDAVLRGTSLEYLESVLPRDVWESLRPHLGDTRSGTASPRAHGAVLEELLLSRQHIEVKLEELRKLSGDA